MRPTSQQPHLHAGGTAREVVLYQAESSSNVRLDSRAHRWLWRIIAAGLLILPLAVIPGKDMLRLAKQLCFTAEGVICAAYLAIAFTLGSLRVPPLRTWRSAERLLPLAIVVWTVITFVVSSNRDCSFRALVWVCSAAAIFAATALTVHDRDELVLWFILIPALINCALAASQTFDIWQPFRFPMSTPVRGRVVALLGNPDDFGVYTATSALASLTMSYVTRGLRRWIFFFCGALLIAGVIVSQVMTAVFALAGGVIVLATSADKRARHVLSATAVAIAITVATYAPIRMRVNALRTSLQTGNLDSALTSRLSAVFAATDMFLRHPIVGVGPGAFGFNYFDYKIATDARYGWLFPSLNAVNFAEAHNDHLQVLATTGVPGYGLMIACFVVIGRRSFWRSRTDDSVRQTFARLFALPFVVCVFILAIGQFPLELGAPLSVILTLAATCVAWLPR